MLRYLFLVGSVLFYGRAWGSENQRSLSLTPYIIGGSDATYNEYPYILQLQYLSASSLQWIYICGAILINFRYALTAAHCLDNMEPSDIRVIAGAILLDGDGTPYTVNSFIKHPDFNRTRPGLPNDIAILNLANSVSGANVGNALLPPDDNNAFVQNNCFVAGWGETNPDSTDPAPVLKKLQIPVIQNLECADDLNGIDIAAIYDTHICTKSSTLDTGSCDSDAGSPLTCCQSDADCSVRYVVGVTSYIVKSQGSCNVRYPTVHVRTSKFLSWIYANTP